MGCVAWRILLCYVNLFVLDSDLCISILWHVFVVSYILLVSSFPSVKKNLVDFLLQSGVTLSSTSRLLWESWNYQTVQTLRGFPWQIFLATIRSASKPLFMIKWQGYCSSQNTWEPKTHLPPKLIEAFKNPDPDPVHMEETRERISLVLKEGWKFLFNTKNRSRLAMMWFASFSQAFQWRSRQHQPILGTRSVTTLAQ